jgi:chromatin remodeling complex protein RSC6
MPKTKQTKSSTESTTTTQSIEVAAPVAPKTTKKSTKKTETPVIESAPVVTATTIPVTEEVAADGVDVEASIAAQSVEFYAKLNQLSTMIGSLKTEYRSLERKWTRELKMAQKLSSKKKRKTGNRQPSGFVKPTKISDELAKFLDKPIGSEMARTDVTREINKYIRTHNLQDKENGRKINPDTKLATLLKLKKTDELTYFNLQRYMSPHFSKTVKEVVLAQA